MAEREQNRLSTLSFSIDNILRDDFPRSSRINRPSLFAPTGRNTQLFRNSIPCHECFSSRCRPVYIYSPSSNKEVDARGLKSHSKDEVRCPGGLNAASKMNEQGSTSSKTAALESNSTDFCCKQEKDEGKLTKNSQKDEPKDKKKRFRSHFSQLQLQYLESIFARQHYLSRDERTLLASALDMTELQVRNWFQNKRYQKRHREIQALQKVTGKQVPVKVLVSDRSPIIPTLGVRSSDMRY